MFEALQMYFDAGFTWLETKMNSPDFLWEISDILIWLAVFESILRGALAKKKSGVDIIMSFLTNTDFGLFNCTAVACTLCAIQHSFGLAEMGIVFGLMIIQYRFVGRSARPVVQKAGDKV